MKKILLFGLFFSLFTFEAQSQEESMTSEEKLKMCRIECGINFPKPDFNLKSCVEFCVKKYLDETLKPQFCETYEPECDRESGAGI